ncbi:hypothetical protein [Mariniflexile maritimum]|jgi:uncharacterized membrane protein|uniref:hypothetical protein n=1 Tax=Mariniflexile maritimum TaxID=2682493 RepID=UPI0012F6EC3D|nr:hypothetical protein [Mariniflexile maritimum]MCB0449436.1 hypothetical protein [Confluentibacter sp.]HMQ43887.1 hypothetical protein [Mariniflexile sp.]
MTEYYTEEGRKHAIISYITIFGTIIAFYLNNDSKNVFASFHIRQALGLWLTFFALGYMVGIFDSWFISSGFYLFFAVLFIFGFVSALNKKMQAVPLVGAFYQKIFANLGN